MQVNPVRRSSCGAIHRRPTIWIPRALLAVIVLSTAFALVACGGGSGGGTIVLPPDNGGGGGGMTDVDPVYLAWITDRWSNSGHNNVNAEAFHHWDADGEVAAACARCHSTPGFRDYIGDDGTAADSADNAHPTGTTINCDACHNDTAVTLDHVVFPSGAILTDLGPEARCMTCHQGRESTVSVNTYMAGKGVGDASTDDDQNGSLGFRNVHYLAAGATLYGGTAMGAYQYTNAGMDMVVGTADDTPKYGYYDKKNPHVAKADTCVECHEQHTLEVRVSLCATCHTGVSNVGDLRNVRMNGSYVDYDGDGNTTEGIYYEIQGLEQILYNAMRAYASGVQGNPIAYDAASYPYFFSDTNDNGIADDGAGSYSNWTARLLRAAYNYHYVHKDPGAWAHNPKYIIEILYDSIADLNANAGVTVPNFAALHRNDTGHFDAGAQAFRHWDGDGEVSVSCARCHSAGGFDFWATYGLDVTLPQPLGDGFRCEQCHVEGADFGGTPEVKRIDEVEFPSGVVVSQPDPMDNDPTFLCISCHKARESGYDVDARATPGFVDLHYLAAGATMWGGDGHVGYEYPMKSYKGKWMHIAEPPINGNPESARCTFCHLTDHSFKPQVTSTCTGCHGNVAIEDIRLNRATDYDGDGDNTEPLKDELATFASRLFAAAAEYESNVYGGTLLDLGHYPYYSATTWDYPLAGAMFNYQFWAKEPGSWAHNTHYMLQLLYDSIEDLQTRAAANNTALGTDYLMGLTRP